MRRQECAAKIRAESMASCRYSDSMNALPLHEFHERLGARFAEVNGAEVVEHYGDALREYSALREAAGVADLSFRGRLCATGADRARFLHGQVTNNVTGLKPGQGCYAALVTAKGKLESDLNIHCLSEELLLDFEPGLSARVLERLERFIVADDVQLVDVAPHYGLLGVFGPKAPEVVERLASAVRLPNEPLASAVVQDASLGEIVVVNHSRGAGAGFDLFVQTAVLEAAATKLNAAANETSGSACGWRALEMVRIEAGLPRFGVDMDESNLAPETGIEARAISYTKGCYIGQEVINKLRTFAHVNRTLRGLRLADDLKTLPSRGDKLFRENKEVGYVTSALASPKFRCNIALACVRRECNEPGTELVLRTSGGESTAVVVALPFSNP
jgi:folate-binding protein YgfZ